MRQLERRNWIAVIACIQVFVLSAVLARADRRDEKLPTFMGRPVYEWGADLKKDDAVSRRVAAFALSKFGPLAAHYGPDLRALLEDPDPGVRQAAALALGEFGALAGAESVPALNRLLLSDSSPAVRRSAASALGNLQQYRGAAAEPLRHALTDADPRVRQSAAWALGCVGESINIAEAVPALRSLLKDEDLLVRRDAAAALGSAGPDAKSAAADLTVLLSDPDAVVPPNAAATLGKIGLAAEGAVPTLVRFVQNPRTEEDLRRQAAVALSRIGGPKVAQALPTLRELLRDKDLAVRKAISAIFVNLNEMSQVYIPDLVACLADEVVEVRRNASAALSKAVEGADKKVIAGIIPALLHCLENDPDTEVRLHIGWCFLGMPASLDGEFTNGDRERLIAIGLQDRNTVVRGEVARGAVRHFGQTAKAVVPTLIAGLRDTNLKIVDSPSAKTESGGTESDAASTTIQNADLGDGRISHARSLGRLGNAAGPEAKRALEEAARDADSPGLREAAREALRSFR